MNKVVKILRELGEAAVKLLLTIVALVMLVALVVLVALAIPACIVLLIIVAVATFIEVVVTFIERWYEEHKKNNSGDMCDKESTEGGTSSSDAARDTEGTQSAGSDNEF